MPDDFGTENWSDNEVPWRHRDVIGETTKSVRNEVRKAHGLGHPSRDTLVRMLKLGGASPEACDYAKVWKCPFCVESAPPEKSPTSIV